MCWSVFVSYQLTLFMRSFDITDLYILTMLSVCVKHGIPWQIVWTDRVLQAKKYEHLCFSLEKHVHVALVHSVLYRDLVMSHSHIKSVSWLKHAHLISFSYNNVVFFVFFSNYLTNRNKMQIYLEKFEACPICFYWLCVDIL